MMCKNCGMENALSTDKQCWHCGKPLFAEAQFSVSDTERVEWLLRKISGKEARRLGIIYSAGLTRQDIDEAIKRTPNTEHHFRTKRT